MTSQIIGQGLRIKPEPVVEFQILRNKSMNKATFYQFTVYLRGSWGQEVIFEDAEIRYSFLSSFKVTKDWIGSGAPKPIVEFQELLRNKSINKATLYCYQFTVYLRCCWGQEIIFEVTKANFWSSFQKLQK